MRSLALYNSFSGLKMRCKYTLSTNNWREDNSNSMQTLRSTPISPRNISHKVFTVEVDQAQFFGARALNVEPEPFQISLKPASSPSFLLMKILIFELEPTSSLRENLTRRASSLGLIFCEPKISPGPLSPSPGSFHL